MSSKSPSELEQFRLHERFEYKITKLARLMQSRLEAGLDKHGITRVQWIALAAIAIEQKSSPSDLAEHIGVSRPAISRMLKQMESSNLLERNLIGVDGRTRQLTLTDKGRQCMIQCWPYVQETERFFIWRYTRSCWVKLNRWTKFRQYCVFLHIIVRISVRP